MQPSTKHTGRGKKKGSKFERTICKQLSRWVSESNREDLFWRSAMSGGRATVAKKGNVLLRNLAGDITAVHAEGMSLTGRWYIECKFYASLSIESFLLSGKGKLDTFWQVALREAVQYRKRPLLIAKQNNTPAIVVLPFDSLESLCHEFNGTKLTVDSESYKCVVVLLDDLLKASYRSSS